MRKFLLAVLFLAPLLLRAQLSFLDLEPDTCAAGNEILRPDQWLIYQTLNNEWNGEPRVDVCPTFLENGSIDLTSVDISTPVFLITRYYNQELEPNRACMLNLSCYGFNCWDDIVDVGNADFCNNEFCNGSRITVVAPYQLEDDEDLIRVYHNEFTPSIWGDVSGNEDYTHCFPSENLEYQYVSEVLLKFNFLPGSTEFPLSTYGIVEDVHSIGQDDIEQFRITVDEFYLEYNPNWDGLNTYLLLHEAEGIPSEENPGYLDFEIIPNLDTVGTVVVEFQEGVNYMFQPFTYLRGGLIANNDSIRHNLEIINDGAGLCFNTYLDVIINRGWTYEHRGGKLEFQGGRSCMQFNEGGKFIISNNSKLEYGMFGKGMLALYNGCQIDIQSGSELVINNTVILEDHNWAPLGASIDVPLVTGAKLTFGPYSRIENWSVEEATKLRIYMLGGQVDLSGLSEADRQHVELIFPETDEDELVVFGNPVEGELEFLWPSPTDEPIEIEVYDLTGKNVWRTKQAPLPSQRQSTSLMAIPSGDYLVMVQQGNTMRSGRIFLAKQNE